MKRKIAMILSMALVFTSVPVNSITGFAEEILIEEPGNESAIAEKAEVGKETEELRLEETEIWQETESVETPEKLAESESMDSVDMTESSDSEQENIDSDMILGDVFEDESEWVTGETSETFNDLEEVETESETESTVNEEIEILNIEEVNQISNIGSESSEKQIEYIDLECYSDKTFFAGESIDSPDCFLRDFSLYIEYTDGSYSDELLDDLSKIEKYGVTLKDRNGQTVAYDDPTLSGRYFLHVFYQGNKTSCEVILYNKSNIIPIIEGEHHQFQVSALPGCATFQPLADGYYIFSSTGQILKFSASSDKVGKLAVQRIGNFRYGVWLTAGDVTQIEFEAKSEDGAEDSVHLSVARSSDIKSLLFPTKERSVRGWSDLYDTDLSVTYMDGSEESVRDFEVNWDGNTVVGAHAITRNGLIFLLELRDANGSIVSSGPLSRDTTYKLRAYFEGNSEIYTEQTIKIGTEVLNLAEGRQYSVSTKRRDANYFEFSTQETADYCISLKDKTRELSAKLNLYRKEGNGKTLIQNADIDFYYAGDDVESFNVHLEKGKTYYLEVLHTYGAMSEYGICLEKRVTITGVEFADIEKYKPLIDYFGWAGDLEFNEIIGLLVTYSNGQQETIHFSDSDKNEENCVAIDRFGNKATYRLYKEKDGYIEESAFPREYGIWIWEVSMGDFHLQTEINYLSVEQAIQTLPKLALNQDNIVSVNKCEEGYAAFEVSESARYTFSASGTEDFYMALYREDGFKEDSGSTIILDAEQGEKYMLRVRTVAPQINVQIQREKSSELSEVKAVNIKEMDKIDAFRLHDELNNTAVTVHYADGGTEDLVDSYYYMETGRGNVLIGKILDQSQNELDIPMHFDEIEYGDIPLGTYEYVLREREKRQIVGKKTFTIDPEASEIISDFEKKVSVEKGKPVAYRFAPTNETAGHYKFYCSGNASDIHLVAYRYDKTNNKLVPFTFACGRGGKAELDHYFALGVTYYLVAEQTYQEAPDQFTVGFGDLNAKPHRHTWKTEKVDATCVKDGYIKYICTTCSEEKTEVIKAKGHNFSGAFTVDKESTCTVAGSKSRKCSRCSAVERVALPLKAHQMKNVIDKQPTCSSAGSQHQECSVCHVKGTVSTLSATGKHQWGNWNTVSAATVFEAESRQHKCGVCGKTEVQKNGEKLSPTMKVSATSVPLKVKQKTTKVTVSDLAAGDYVKSWKSSNKKIVKVNGAGRLTAGEKTGKAVVTVTLASGLTKDIKVAVQKGAVKTKKIKGVPKKLSMKAKETYDLAPVISPITSQDKIKYTTSNKKVATVNSKGKIKAKKKGSAVITIKCGSKSVKCKVKVK